MKDYTVIILQMEPLIVSEIGDWFRYRACKFLILNSKSHAGWMFAQLLQLDWSFWLYVVVLLWSQWARHLRQWLVKKAQKKKGISIFEVLSSDICKHWKSRLARGNLFSHSFFQRCTVTDIKEKKGLYFTMTSTKQISHTKISPTETFEIQFAYLDTIQLTWLSETANKWKVMV